MNWDEIAQTLATIIPLASFAALVVSVFIFVRYKGTIDALKEAVSTYQSLADAYKEKVEQLEYKLDCCQKEIDELKKLLVVQREALTIAVDETIAGFTRHGWCAEAPTCKDFKADDREK